MKPRRRLQLPKLLHLNHLTIRSVFTILVILALVQLIISNSFISEGEKTKSLQNETEKIEKENKKLINQIQVISSLSYLEKKAIEKGFSKDIKVEYITGEVTVALR